MSLWTIARFQAGHRAAIEEVARTRNSLWVGMGLVLMTAIARNYDQTYFLESPFWLFGPFLFSLFSGSFLFLVLYKGFIQRHLPGWRDISTKAQWRGFMSLFWMTAPVAWLYAIPVERFLNSYHAAQANLVLLAVVSLWRVLLMARILSVLQGVHFLRATAWVLVPACMEVLLTAFSPAFGGQILATMSGMRHAPEKELVLRALGNCFAGAFVLLVLVLILLGVRRLHENVSPFPEADKGPTPWLGLFSIALVWPVIAIPAQMEQYRFITHAKLIEDGKYRESVDYLARFTRKGFPPSRRLEPDPYEYPVFERLPKVMAALQATDPEWVRQVYSNHMEVLFSHYFIHCEAGPVAQMFLALERLPEGRAWVLRNRSILPQLKMVTSVRYGSTSEADALLANQQLTNVLQRLGVDLTDLDSR